MFDRFLSKNNLNNYHFSSTLTPYTNVRMGGGAKPYSINFFYNNKLNKRVL